MHNFSKLGIVFLVLLSVFIQMQTSAKTANIINIYRKEVFDIAVMRNRKPVIVFYNKPSCILCTRLQTKMEKIAKENSEKYYFAKVDLEKMPEMKEEFGITSVPTVRAYNHGQMIDEVKGLKGISMMELVDSVLAL